MIDELLERVSGLFVGNGLIIVLGCFIIGTFLKGSIKILPNRFIPYINSVIAVILGFLIPNTLEDEPIVSKIILLAFLGLSSVGLYEAICTAVKNRFSVDINKIYNNMINQDKNSESDHMPEDIPEDDDINSIISSLDDDSDS